MSQTPSDEGPDDPYVTVGIAIITFLIIIVPCFICNVVRR